MAASMTSTNHKSRRGGSLSPINTSGQQCSYQNTSSNRRISPTTTTFNHQQQPPMRRGGSLSPINTLEQNTVRRVISPINTPIRKGGSLSPIFPPSSDNTTVFIHDPSSNRRSRSAIPPPLVMDTHPSLRKLSNLHHKQNHFNSMPDFKQTSILTSTTNSSSRLNSRSSLSPSPQLEDDETGIYSRLNHSISSPPIEPQHYLVQGYNQLTVIQDSTNTSPDWNSPSTIDGYTYIDIDSIKNQHQKQDKEREGEESTDLPGHHYFVLEIPEDSDGKTSPQDSDVYSYVDVNRGRISAPLPHRSPSPTSMFGRQVSAYEQPIKTLNRKTYTPVTLGTHKRMGVASVSKAHPSHLRADGYCTLPNTRSTCKTSVFPLLSPSCISPTSPRTSPVPPPSCISPTSPCPPSSQRRISPTSPRVPNLVTRHTSPCVSSPTPNNQFFSTPAADKRSNTFSSSIKFSSQTSKDTPAKRCVTPLATASNCGTMSHDNHVSLIITPEGPVLSTRRRSSTNPDSVTLSDKTNK